MILQKQLTAQRYEMIKLVSDELINLGFKDVDGGSVDGGSVEYTVYFPRIKIPRGSVLKGVAVFVTKNDSDDLIIKAIVTQKERFKKWNWLTNGQSYINSKNFPIEQKLLGNVSFK